MLARLDDCLDEVFNNFPVGLKKGVYFINNNPLQVRKIHLVSLVHSWKSSIVRNQNVYAIFYFLFLIKQRSAYSNSLTFHLAKMT